MKTIPLSIAVCSLLLATCGNHNPSGDTSKTQPEKKKLIGDTSALSKSGNSNVPTSASGNTDSAKTKGTSFYQLAIQNNNAEIEMAKLALQKSADPEIKKAANVLIQDHNSILKQLKTIADSSWKADTTQSEEVVAAIKGLSADAGKVFDNKWLNEMIDGHDKIISEYQAALNTIKNPQLQLFINLTLPKIKDHKKMLESIRQKG